MPLYQFNTQRSSFGFCSPLYQAIMENPLVQLSLNNKRVLGG